MQNNFEKMPKRPDSKKLATKTDRKAHKMARQMRQNRHNFEDHSID